MFVKIFSILNFFGFFRYFYCLDSGFYFVVVGIRVDVGLGVLVGLGSFGEVFSGICVCGRGFVVRRYDFVYERCRD